MTAYHLRGKIAPWTLADQRAAYRQGWNVFNSGAGVARIEKDDDGDLESDSDAWDIITKGAAKGQAHCRRALLHVAIHNQREFWKIRKHLEGFTV